MRLNFGDSGKGSMGSGFELFPKTTKKVKEKLARALSGVDPDELRDLQSQDEAADDDDPDAPAEG